jgi:MFS family permease
LSTSSASASASGHAPSAPPKAFAALHHPGARPFLFGMWLAMLGDSIEHVISYWIIFHKFHSTALGGFAVISHWAPFLLFSVWTGMLADRYDTRRIIQLGMVMFALASLAWGVLFLTDSLQMWHAAAILIVHGIAGVLAGPAVQMMIQDIVTPAQLQSGVRLMATARTLGFLLGPAIGGALMIVLDPAIAILLNALIYVFMIVWLWKAPYGPKFRKDPRPPRAVRGLADIISAIKVVAQNPAILTTIVISGCASFFVGNAYQPQLPEFLVDLGYGEDEFRYSLILGANATGAVIAGLVLEMRGMLQANPRTVIFLNMGWCISIGIFAMSNNYVLSVACLLCAGFLYLSCNSMAQTLVQLNAPPESRGKVIGLYTTAAQGLIMFSGLTVGVAGAWVGIHLSLAINAAILLVVAVCVLLFLCPKADAKTRSGA